MLSANADLTDEQKSQLESQLVMLQAEPLYLDPTPPSDDSENDSEAKAEEEEFEESEDEEEDEDGDQKMEAEPAARSSSTGNKTRVAPGYVVRDTTAYRRVRESLSYTAGVRRRKFLEHEDAYPHRPFAKRMLEIKSGPRKKRRFQVSISSMDELNAAHKELMPEGSVDLLVSHDFCTSCRTICTSLRFPGLFLFPTCPF